MGRHYGRGLRRSESVAQKNYWRRTLHQAAHEDERDIGNRPGIAKVLGFDPETGEQGETYYFDGIPIHEDIVKRIDDIIDGPPPEIVGCHKRVKFR